MFVAKGLRWSGGPPVSLQLGPGEILCVTGPSGSGKTRLLRALADLDPSEGMLALDGEPCGAMSGPRWRRRVRYCAAEPGWWSDPIGLHFAPQPDAETLAVLGLDPAILTRRVAETSTGERQRLALIRAMQPDPRVLLLDEPTAALDGAATDRVEAWLRRLVASGRCAVVVTHDPAQPDRLRAHHLSLTESNR